jgi:hypothetical protein
MDPSMIMIIVFVIFTLLIVIGFGSLIFKEGLGRNNNRISNLLNRNSHNFDGGKKRRIQYLKK